VNATRGESPTNGATIRVTLDTISLTEIAEKPPRNSRKAVNATMSDPDFDAFYKAYPRHIGARAARLRWDALREAGELPALDVLLAAVEQQKRHDPKWQSADKTFIPHPATWLNAGRWADEVAEGTDGRDYSKW